MSESDLKMRSAMGVLIEQYKEENRLENDYGLLAMGYADGFQAGWRACEKQIADAYGRVIDGADKWNHTNMQIYGSAECHPDSKTTAD